MATNHPHHDSSSRANDPDLGIGNELDPASESLADALRKSFRVLKVIMFVLVGLYFLSGWTSVKPGERGYILRFGKIVNAGTPAAVLGEGWHWSWPYPIDKFMTVSEAPREMEIKFMLALRPEELAKEKIDSRFGPLSPARDDYLVTGDVNILHANLVIKYEVSNVLDYVTNTYPMPDPKRKLGSRRFRRYPEYTILRNLARNAVQ